MGWIIYAAGVVGFIVIALLLVREVLFQVGHALGAM